MGRLGKCVASCVWISPRRQEEHRITTSIYINVSLTAYTRAFSASILFFTYFFFETASLNFRIIP